MVNRKKLGYRMRVAAIADTHIERFAHTFSRGDKSSVDLQLDAIRQVLVWCDFHNIDNLIHAGDVFDSYEPTQDSVIKLLTLIAEFPKITWHIILGNHDYLQKGSHGLVVTKWAETLKLLPIKVYLEPTKVKIGGIKFGMVPWPYKEPIEGVDWNVGHFSWQGALRDNGSPEKSGHAPAGRWILGHFHMHQSDDRHVYVGSLNQCSWAESARRGFITVTKKEFEFQKIKNPYTLALATITDPAEINKLDPAKLWKLTLKDCVPPADWAANNPNVLFINYDRTRPVDDDGDNIFATGIDALELLPEELLRYGLNEQDYKYALDWVEGLRSHKEARG
jgi:predicted phosphodiesterase